MSHARHGARALASVLASVLFGCDAPAATVDGGRDAGTDAPDAPDLPCLASATPSRLVVTADWLNRSLTLLGLERVLDPGCTAEEAIVGTIDLSAYVPGPLELEISPDGRTALVAVGPGFYEGAGALLAGEGTPEAEGTLLVVDLETRSVAAEIATAAVPMGIAFSPDGARAYVAEYGLNAAPGSAIAVIDVAARSLVAEVDVGSRPEQVALSSDGTIGAVSVDDGVRVFVTADLGMASAISPVVFTGRDPSGVGFAEGTRTLVVTNSMAASYSVLDATDPVAPVIVATPEATGFPYAAVPIWGSTDVLVTTSLREELLRVHAESPSTPHERFPLPYGSFLLGAVVTRDGQYALAPHSRSHTLAVVDLETGATHGIAWLEAAGPTYVALEP